MESRRETVRRWLVRGTRKPLAVVTPRSGLPPAVPLTAVAPRGQRARLAFGIVLLGAAVSASTFFLASQQYDSAAQDQLASQANALATALSVAFSSSDLQLYALRGLFEASDEVRADEFQRFATGIMEIHPEIRRIAWNLRLPPASAAARRQFLDAHGLAGIEPWRHAPDGDREPVPPGSEAVVIALAYPFGENRSLVGFDLTSEPGVEVTLRKSAGASRPVRTGALELRLGNRPDEIGVHSFLPVYGFGSLALASSGTQPAGWVSITISPQAVADQLAAERWYRHGWAFTLWDYVTGHPVLLAHWGGVPAPPGSEGTFDNHFEVGERQLLAVMRPLLPQRRSHEPFGMAGSVLGLTVLIGFMVWRLDHQRSLADWLSRTDPLTRLANRRELERALEEALDSGVSVSLILADIDFFKSVNDSFGHAAGDRVLQLVADALRRSVRGGTDRVGRMGGEEFAVLLCGLEEEEIVPVWRRLHEQIDALEPQLPKPVTLSVGIASTCLEEPGTPLRSGVLSAADRAELLLRNADNALYEAKHRGRDRAIILRHGAFETPAEPPTATT